MRRSAAFVKFTQWEHWPTMVYYLPLFPFFLWRSLKAGHPFYFAVANPGILYAGSGTESKFKTLSLLPRNLIPESFLFKRTDPISSLTKSIRENDNSQFIGCISIKRTIVKILNDPSHCKIEVISSKGTWLNWAELPCQ